MSNRKKHAEIVRSSEDVVRLFSGDLNPDEVSRLKGWPEDSKEYQDYFLGAMQMFSDLESLADDPDVLSAADRLPDRSVCNEVERGEKSDLTGVKRKLTSKSWFAVAATVLVAAVVGFIQWQEEGAETNNLLRYVTRVGEQKVVNLPDGSAINLNTSSQVVVDFSDTHRRVFLDRGEAYFDINKEPERPFTVDLGTHSVTVVGTEFNIHKSPNKYVLAVTEGAVALHERGSQISIRDFEEKRVISVSGSESKRFELGGSRKIAAGTVVEFNVARQEFSAHAPVEMDRYQAWRSGTISFQSEPLHKVVLELNRYSGKKILIDGLGIRDLEVYAAVKVDRVDVALAVLERALPIKVVHYFDRIVLIEDDS